MTTTNTNAKRTKRTTADQMTIFGLLDLFGTITRPDIADRLPWHSTKAIDAALASLIEDGAIERIGASLVAVVSGPDLVASAMEAERHPPDTAEQIDHARVHRCASSMTFRTASSIALAGKNPMPITPPVGASG